MNVLVRVDKKQNKNAVHNIMNIKKLQLKKIQQSRVLLLRRQQNMVYTKGR